MLVSSTQTSSTMLIAGRPKRNVSDDTLATADYSQAPQSSPRTYVSLGSNAKDVHQRRLTTYCAIIVGMSCDPRKCLTRSHTMRTDGRQRCSVSTIPASPQSNPSMILRDGRWGYRCPRMECISRGRSRVASKNIRNEVAHCAATDASMVAYCPIQPGPTIMHTVVVR